jgi:hypothetical protein
MELLNKLDKILKIVESNDYAHPSKPGKFSEIIADVGEKAFQRAILTHKDDSVLFFDENGNINVTWYDLELPVVLNKNSRRSCIDLIGQEKKGLKRFVLCELKFNNEKDTPISAVQELLGYYRLILKNASNLDHFSIHHKNEICKKFIWEWSSILIKVPFLVVAANEKYWLFWERKIDLKEQIKQINLWSIELGIDIILYKIKDCDFVRQKSSMATYKPELETNEPWIRIN